MHSCLAFTWASSLHSNLQHAVAKSSQTIRYRSSQGNKISLAVSHCKTSTTILFGEILFLPLSKKFLEYDDEGYYWSSSLTMEMYLQVFVHLFMMYLLHRLQVCFWSFLMYLSPKPRYYLNLILDL